MTEWKNRTGRRDGPTQTNEARIETTTMTHNIAINPKSRYMRTLLLVSLLCPLFGLSQVGIGTDGIENTSAKLEVKSTTQGFLPPRVALTSTSTAGNAINSPATGLLVYNTATASSGATAVTPGFYYYDGSRWQRVSAQQPDATVSFNQITPTSIGVVFTPDIPANPDYVYVSSLDNSKWTYEGSTNTYSKTFQKSIVTGYFSNSNGTGLRVLECTETQDRNNDFANNTFTAPRPGLYLVTANLMTAQKSWALGEELNIGAYQAGNNTPFFQGQFFAQAAISTFGIASSSCVIALTAGQQFNFQSFNAGSFSLYGSNYNQFSITEL